MFNEEENQKIKKIIKWVIVAIFALIISFGSWFTVGAGQVGVVTRFGAVNRVSYPGVGFKIPLIEGVTTMDTKTQKDQTDARAASQDLQSVHATIAVNYHLEGSHAVDVYQNIGPNYQDAVIAPAIQNTFKGITAKFTAEQLITQREAVRIQAEESLRNQLAVYHVQVDNFNIVNFDFSPEFDAAIEQKQVAQQSVETAKQKLAQAQIDAQSVVAVQKGQADAQALLKNTGSLSPEYLEYLALNKWDGKLPTVTGGGTPFINIPNR